MVFLFEKVKNLFIESVFIHYIPVNHNIFFNSLNFLFEIIFLVQGQSALPIQLKFAKI